MKTYHILKNGVPTEISVEELNMLKENNDEILLDTQWYLNNGYISAEDFDKTHS